MVLPAYVKHVVAGFVLALLPAALYAQSDPTATQAMELSAFGGINGTYTGILDGRNLSITAGGNLAFREIFGLRPGIEIRGTIPLDNGSVAGERNILAGITLAKHVKQFNFYGDFLYGRGEMRYQNGGLLNAAQTIILLSSNSSVLSPGFGIEYRISRRFSLKGDAQFERYATPFTQQPLPPPGPIAVVVRPSVIVAIPGTLTDLPGHATAKAFTLALKYRFNFNKHYPR